MARQKPARPFYEVFLERVIKIEAVQRYRAVVTDDTAKFFEEGQRPGASGNFLWSLDRLEPFRSGPVAGVVFPSGLYLPAAFDEPPLSLPMLRAWDTAVARWKAFIAALANGELIANGVHPGTGVRSELHPTEWARTGLVLNVRNGDLLEGGYSSPIGKHTVRWSAIALRAARQTRQNQRSAPTKARWHGYDWDEAWAYALTLRAEDKWDWAQHTRDKKQPLPALRKSTEERIEQWFKGKGNTPDIGDIRRNITTPLYAGKHRRVKRKR